jgi:hypothetical protein
MKRTIMTLTLALMALAVVGEALPASAAVVKPKPIVYNSIPRNLPGNVPAHAFQAQQTSEFGDVVSFAPGTTDQLKQVTVVMSSWACQSGTWNGGDCVSAAGSGFMVPITFTLYEHTPDSPTAGPIIIRVTKTFKIPYRPSADAVNCPANPGKYQAADGICYNGFARRISFAFDGVTLPSEAVYGITFNTSGYGPQPKGDDNPCNSTVQGCPYDSLNVSAASSTPSRGSDLAPNGVFLNSATPTVYCDDGVGGTNTFRLDDGCWTGFNPMVKFKVKL